MTAFESDNTDRNLDYLHGRMSAAERLAFEQEIANDPNLKRQLGLDIVIKGELTRREALKKKFNDIFDQIEENPRPVIIQPSPNRSVFESLRHQITPSPTYWLVAASVLLVVGAGLWYWSNTNSVVPMAEQKPKTDTLTAPSLKTDVPIAETPQPAVAENRELALAETQYNEAFDGGSLVAMRSGDAETGLAKDSTAVMNGIGLLRKNKAKEAVALLENTSRQSAQNQWQQAADWYLALAYLKKGDLNKAKTLVTDIKNNPDHLYSIRAQALSMKLE
jgi:hypothetical protein